MILIFFAIGHINGMISMALDIKKRKTVEEKEEVVTKILRSSIFDLHRWPLTRCFCRKIVRWVRSVGNEEEENSKELGTLPAPVSA